jgi:hypothetical protein
MRGGFHTRRPGVQRLLHQEPDGLAVTCQDDATSGPNACDRDTIQNQCTFLVFYCLQNLALDGTSCSPRPIGRLALLDATTLDPPAQDAVLDGFATTMVRFGGAGSVSAVPALPGELAAIAPAVPVNPRGGATCGALEVVVARPGMSAASEVLAVKATDTDDPPRDDVDRVTFVCNP